MSNPLIRGADLPFQVEYIRTVDSSTHTRWQTRWLHIPVFVQMIYPLIRVADEYSLNHKLLYDSSPPARGRLRRNAGEDGRDRFIPSCEGQTSNCLRCSACSADSSLPAKGRLQAGRCTVSALRFIPSCEGQADEEQVDLSESSDSSLPAKGRPKIAPRYRGFLSIHPFLRRAGIIFEARVFFPFDSSLPTKGGRAYLAFFHLLHRFIPSYEGQPLSVYAAFSRFKHLVV